MKIYYLLILSFALACKGKRTDCRITAEEVMKNNPGKVHAGWLVKGKILGISDNGTERDDGRRSVYYFFPNGQLESYKYFQSDSVYTYEEKYDQNGQLAKIIGKPLVNRDIREVNRDSARFRFSLFSLHKTYKNIKAITSYNENLDLDLKEDKFCTNVKSAIFAMSTKGLTAFKIYFSAEFENECTGKSGVLADTISLVKNPRLNLVEP